MTGADVAQSELGDTVAGIKIAIMDTGIDYDHADLGGDGVQRSNSDVFPTRSTTRSTRVSRRSTRPTRAASRTRAAA